MNRISFVRLRLALKFGVAVQSSRSGGWLVGKAWARQEAMKLPAPLVFRP